MSSAGKTAPKLFHDFLVFDPLKVHNNANILTDIPPPVGEGSQISPGIGSCKHDYSTKWKQSISPALDERPQRGSQYKAAVVCKKCRLHAYVQIAYLDDATNPCTRAEFPLHHFVRRQEEDETTHNRIVYAWVCSAPECRAHLKATYRLPRLAQADIKLLTDPALLQSRFDATFRADPAREGLKLATPMDAIGRLRRYLKDALNPEHTRRTFPANNKRFMEAFGVDGQDCAELLNKLGFRFQPTRGSELDGTVQDATWTLPNPAEIASRFQADGESHREALEDVDAELVAWMYELASRLSVPNPASAEGWPSADRDIERLLAAQGYKRHPSLRRAGVSNEDLAYFASLGAQPDFADELVVFAFDRQFECDPSNGPYYLECLQVITAARGTEQLQLKVATLESQDLISRRDLTNAYRSLNCTRTESDERILGLFQVRQSDTGPSGQEDLRQALYKIGMSRQSQRLINASRQTIETYEDALLWIGNGVDKNTADEMLLATAVTQGNEQTSGTEMAKKAISIIAKERKSNILNNWLLGGDTNGHSMGVEEALRHLGVSESFSTLDKEVLSTVLAAARTDRPGEQTEKAVAVLEQAMASWTTHSAETWPVGLTSHGNTCYLNSLLQYYFSIKPLRDIILDYDQYKLDTERYSEKDERVGQRKISMVEIKGGQRFAEDLKFLFERMIKDPRQHFKPEEDLVCRAFLEPKDFALLASSIREEQAASKANGTSLDAAVDEKLTEDTTTAAAPADSQGSRQSDASSVTLVGDEMDIAMNDARPPTPPASPKLDSQKPEDAPPPLPPRRFSTAKEQALVIAQQNAKSQQDVTEVHDGIMFRLRSGMMPKGVDEGGEQQDDLRGLFSIGLAETAVLNGVDGKQKELSDSSIQLNVPSEPTDIYSALDAIFDLQSINENSSGGAIESYRTIRRLPPLLQINIPRIGFSEARGGAYKSEVTVKLQDDLYLDRYTDHNQVDILPRRKACWGWRKQLQQLRQEQSALNKTSIDLDGPSAVNETANYLNMVGAMGDELEDIGLGRIDVPSELSFNLTCDAEEQSNRLGQLQKEIEDLSKKLGGQFDEMKEIKYCLAAVFIHRGTHGHGHYWIYIKDFAKGIWRKYNDEKVEEYSNVNEILEAKTWEHGTPTYAVYVQDQGKLDIIQPVCRAPEALPAPPEQAPEQAQLQPTTFKAPEPRKEGFLRGDSPTLLNEGGDKTWDDLRQVGDAKW
ncbi:ubiquitin carboxyl-terminal hydrolase like protein [Zymoseptoria brevis]|uniref:ubiquitinyl hydrolase 1 n=1 Tax=Zymoseptoria brevis TaxID=1047168 RepID=A0A0F4GB86_9PEZI|nr:ubiquitin carboxyl-terminal hydrolase like protein [Zymoseptoria brevis]